MDNIITAENVKFCYANDFDDNSPPKVILDDISMDLECLKIDANDEEWVLHLNEKFLLEENTIDQDKIIPLLYTLKMNQLSNHYVIKINDEVVRIDGFENESFAFHDLNLNIFEE